MLKFETEAPVCRCARSIVIEFTLIQIMRC